MRYAIFGSTFYHMKNKQKICGKTNSPFHSTANAVTECHVCWQTPGLCLEVRMHSKASSIADQDCRRHFRATLHGIVHGCFSNVPGARQGRRRPDAPALVLPSWVHLLACQHALGLLLHLRHLPHHANAHGSNLGLRRQFAILGVRGTAVLIVRLGSHTRRVPHLDGLHQASQSVCGGGHPKKRTWLV